MDGSRAEKALRAAVDAGHVLSASLALIDGDRVSFVAAGRTSVEDEGVPVTPTTLFDLGSFAKMFCAALVMRLVETGALDLDVSVEEYLPGFAFDDRANGPRVTLRHVLSHSSGLPGAGKDRGPCGPTALRDFAYEQLVHYRFVAPPGRVHIYSNTAFCLAGHVAEAVTGRAYRDLVHEHVFGALGMTRTTFDRAVAMTYRVALAHEEDDDGQVVALHRWTDNRSGEPSSFAVGSVVDLANLARMHLNRGRLGGQHFVSSASIEAMHAPQVGRRILGASHPFAHMYAGYGLAMMTGSYRGARVRRHGGTSQSFNCFFELLPDVGRGFVLLTNYGDDGKITELVLDLYDALLDLPRDARVVPAPASAETQTSPNWVAEYEGTYVDTARGRLATVRHDGGLLVLEAGGSSQTLVPIGEGAFYTTQPDGSRQPVAFLAGGADACGHLIVGGQPFERTRSWTDTPAGVSAWSELAGTYADPSNPDEGAIIRIAVEGQQLWFETDWSEGELTPFGSRRFLADIGLLEFGDDACVVTVGGATRYYRNGPPRARPGA